MKFPVFLFLLSPLAYLSSEESSSYDQLRQDVNQISIRDGDQILGAKNGSARPLRDQPSWITSITPFIWQSEIDGAEYVAEQEVFIPSPIVEVQTLPNLPFHWNFGFKAGVGYNFAYDEWDLSFETIYFKNKGSKTTTASGFSGLVPIDEENLDLTASSQFFATVGGRIDVGTTANAEVQDFYNDYHLDLGRSFFVSKHLAFRPFLGLQATWLKIKTSSSLTGGGFFYDSPDENYVLSGLGDEVLYSKKTSNFIGGGIRFGADLDFKITQKFSLFGNLSSALLNGYFKRTIYADYTGYPDNYYDGTARFHRFMPMFFYELGFSFNQLFKDKTQNLQVDLSYQGTYFLNGVYIKLGRVASSLGMQGVNLKFRYDF